MATNNAINVTTAGIVKYDGAGTFAAVTLTQYSPLVGAASNGITSLGPMTNGQILIGSTGANPVVASLTAGTNITITPGAGSITISSTGTSSGDGAPIGQLAYFATSGDDTYPNPNWLKCDGSVYDQATYTTLFSRLGLINSAGNVWTTRETTLTDGLYFSSYGDGLYFVSGGTNVATSDDTITWTTRTTGTSSTKALTYGNSLYVIAGTAGMLKTSTDTITWDSRTSDTSSEITRIEFGTDSFVYIGAGGALGTSTDGVTWDGIASGTTWQIESLAYGDGLFVIGGYAGYLKTSTDGVTWDARTSGTSVTIKSIIYGDSIYVYADNSGAISTSTDAITWSSPVNPLTNKMSIQKLLYCNDIYFGATNTRIYKSVDLDNWALVKMPIDSYGTSIIYLPNLFGSKLVVPGSLKGSVYAVYVTDATYTYETDTQFQVPTSHKYISMGYSGTNFPEFFDSLSIYEDEYIFERDLYIKAL